MPPRKTANQKQGDLLDTHRILKAFYEVNGPPAGCDMSKLPMAGVPNYHRKQADYLLKELKNRQVVKTRLSEECLRQWAALVKQYRKENLFWFRDNLPRLLNGLPHSQGKPQTKLERILSSVELTLGSGHTIINDRQQHHLIESDKPETVKCFLTGQEWHVSCFK